MGPQNYRKTMTELARRLLTERSLEDLGNRPKEHQETCCSSHAGTSDSLSLVEEWSGLIQLPLEGEGDILIDIRLASRFECRAI